MWMAEEKPTRFEWNLGDSTFRDLAHHQTFRRDVFEQTNACLAWREQVGQARPYSELVVTRVVRDDCDKRVRRAGSFHSVCIADGLGLRTLIELV